MSETFTAAVPPMPDDLRRVRDADGDCWYLYKPRAQVWAMESHDMEDRSWDAHVAESGTLTRLEEAER